MYNYLHDQNARTVYRLPAEPLVIEQTKRGKRMGWRVTSECRITRADNWLQNGRWKYPTSDCPVQHLDARYTKEQALSYFRMHHEPRGEEIGADEYARLHLQYEIEAKSRRPDTQA